MNAKTIKTAICLAAFAGAPMHMAAQADEEPIITFHTNVYDNLEGDNAFHIILGAKEETWIDIDFGFGPEEQLVEQAVYNPETMQVDGTWILGSVSKEGIVRIYGDPKLIDYVEMEGCYITSIDFPKLTEVEVLNLEYNELEALDLSHMKKLQALYLTGNPFNKKPLVIGNDKPDLTILEMSIIDNLDPGFDITGYPNLMSFEAWHVPSMTHLDPSKCPNLLRLSIDITGVAALDVSKNEYLRVLNIGQTLIPSIDLSHSPNLTEFYCSNSGALNREVQLTEIDLTYNPLLYRLDLGHNKLKEIDLSQNPYLGYCQLRYNELTDIDITQNPDIYMLDIAGNRMGFANLPAERETFLEYYYSQQPIPTAPSYSVGMELDFSKFLCREGSVTTPRLIGFDREDPSNPVEMDQSCYTYDNGRIKLTAETADSVFFQFSNSVLGAYPMTTGKFMVKSPENYGKPNAVAKVSFSSLKKDLALHVGISGATAENPKTFTVDFGDGKLTEFTATGDGFPEAANVTGTRTGTNTTVYVDEGDFLTAFGVSAGRITGIDLSQASSIRDLRINDASLAAIDLSWNSSLQHLDLSRNNLAELNLTGANSLYEKSMLSELILANNRLTSLTQPERYGMKKLDVSGNNFAELNLQNYSNLTELNLDDNQLTDINLQDLESLAMLTAKGNNLTELTLLDYVPLKSLDITGNNFTFAGLPADVSVADYRYAPQKAVQLPAKAPTANLSALWYVDAAGQQTAFKWYLEESGAEVAAGTITGKEGRFKFTDPDLGKVVCRMTHPAFPQFSGDNVMTTTAIETAPAPTHVFASFKTLEDQEGLIILTGAKKNATVYVDWTGEGDFEQYILDTSYIRFPAESFAGREVKCYSYEEDDELTVFSLQGFKLGYIDASPMKGLTTFSVAGGLGDGDITLPQSNALEELLLSDNALTAMPALAGYPSLKMLNLSHNNIKKLDVSGLKSLLCLYASSNGLTEVKLDNPKLYDLDLVDNDLESIDFSGAPELSQLFLSENKLKTLDVDCLEKLIVLFADRNDLSFATLPLPSQKYVFYLYNNQHPLTPEVADGKVDLSVIASRNGTESEYTWYIDSPYFDENGDLTGEELYADEEYKLEGGVTTFLGNFRNLVCVITNPLFPDLYMYTDFLNVELSGVERVEDSEDGEAVYYDLRGIKTERPVKGLYIKVKDGKAEKVML